MDNVALCDLIKQIPELRYKYMGTFASDTFPGLKKNTFQIINTQKQTEIGEHWIMLANRNGKIYYGDSLGEPIENYNEIYKRLPYSKINTLVQRKLQNLPFCGLYSIYFAWTVFSNFPIGTVENDLFLLKFIYKYL